MTQPIFEGAMFALRHKKTKALLNCPHGGLKLFWEPEEAKAYARQLKDYEHVRYLVTLIEVPSRRAKVVKSFGKQCTKCGKVKSAVFFHMVYTGENSENVLSDMCIECFRVCHPRAKKRRFSGP